MVRVTLLAMSAVVLAVVVALLGLRMSPAGSAEAPAGPATDVVAPPPPASRQPAVVPPAPVAMADRPAPPPARAPVARAVPRTPAKGAEPPEKEDEPFTIGGPDDEGGLKVFPPMGTKPIKRGIIVPDDYELPPGYVRHFQSTDDGERLPAILMFSPDYEWMDAQGRPVALPADRVVPPEMAPPGLPIELLQPPAQKPPPDNRP